MRKFALVVTVTGPTSPAELEPRMYGRYTAVESRQVLVAMRGDLAGLASSAGLKFTSQMDKSGAWLTAEIGGVMKVWVCRHQMEHYSEGDFDFLVE